MDECTLTVRIEVAPEVEAGLAASESAPLPEIAPASRPFAPPAAPTSAQLLGQAPTPVYEPPAPAPIFKERPKPVVPAPTSGPAETIAAPPKVEPAQAAQPTATPAAKQEPAAKPEQRTPTADVPAPELRKPEPPPAVVARQTQDGPKIFVEAAQPASELSPPAGESEAGPAPDPTALLGPSVARAVKDFRDKSRPFKDRMRLGSVDTEVLDPIFSTPGLPEQAGMAGNNELMRSLENAIKRSKSDYQDPVGFVERRGEEIDTYAAGLHQLAGQGKTIEAPGREPLTPEQMRAGANVYQTEGRQALDELRQSWGLRALEPDERRELFAAGEERAQAERAYEKERSDANLAALRKAEKRAKAAAQVAERPQRPASPPRVPPQPPPVVNIEPDAGGELRPIARVVSPRAHAPSSGQVSSTGPTQPAAPPPHEATPWSPATSTPSTAQPPGTETVFHATPPVLPIPPRSTATEPEQPDDGGQSAALSRAPVPSEVTRLDAAGEAIHLPEPSPPQPPPVVEVVQQPGGLGVSVTPPPAEIPGDTTGLAGMGQKMADAITQNLYGGMFDRLQAGKMPDPGMKEHELPPTSKAALLAHRQGLVKTPADVKRFAGGMASARDQAQKAGQPFGPEQMRDWFEREVEAVRREMAEQASEQRAAAAPQVQPPPEVQAGEAGVGAGELGTSTAEPDQPAVQTPALPAARVQPPPQVAPKIPPEFIAPLLEHLPKDEEGKPVLSKKYAQQLDEQLGERGWAQKNLVDAGLATLEGKAPRGDARAPDAKSSGGGGGGGGDPPNDPPDDEARPRRSRGRKDDDGGGDGPRFPIPLPVQVMNWPAVAPFRPPEGPPEVPGKKEQPGGEPGEQGKEGDAGQPAEKKPAPPADVYADAGRMDRTYELAPAPVEQSKPQPPPALPFDADAEAKKIMEAQRRREAVELARRRLDRPYDARRRQEEAEEQQLQREDEQRREQENEQERRKADPVYDHRRRREEEQKQRDRDQAVREADAEFDKKRHREEMSPRRPFMDRARETYGYWNRQAQRLVDSLSADRSKPQPPPDYREFLEPEEKAGRPDERSDEDEPRPPDDTGATDGGASSSRGGPAGARAARSSRPAGRALALRGPAAPEPPPALPVTLAAPAESTASGMAGAPAVGGGAAAAAGVIAGGVAVAATLMAEGMKAAMNGVAAALDATRTGLQFKGEALIHGIGDVAEKVPILGSAAGNLIHSLAAMKDATDQVINRFAKFSGPLAGAQAAEEMRRLDREMQRARKFGPELQDLAAGRTRTNTKLDDLADRMAPLFLKLAEFANKKLGDMADNLSSLIELIARTILKYVENDKAKFGEAIAVGLARGFGFQVGFGMSEFEQMLRKMLAPPAAGNWGFEAMHELLGMRPGRGQFQENPMPGRIAATPRIGAAFRMP